MRSYFKDFVSMPNLDPVDTPATPADVAIIEDKLWRKELDSTLQKLKSSSRTSRERSLAITNLQQAIMWLGMDLKELGTPNPYPQSYNPESKVVEPTADGLKL